MSTLKMDQKIILGPTLKRLIKLFLVYANAGNPEKCLVALLDKYLSKLPPIAFQKDIFYMRPKLYAPQDAPWFEGVPVRKEKLRTMLADMCKEAGIERKTNHSLRATGASQMFNANVPEKHIQTRTGHHTVEALRLYERPSHKEQQAVSNVLTSSSKRSFGKELSNVVHPQLSSVSFILSYLVSFILSCQVSLVLSFPFLNLLHDIK